MTYCRCQGSEWITHGDGVRPCEQCNPAAYAKWRAGGFMPKWWGRILQPTDTNVALIKLADVIEEHDWLKERKESRPTSQ